MLRHFYLGFSLRTQEIYLLIFVARYNDLFYEFISIYNTCMKIAFIILTLLIIYLMKFQFPYSKVLLLRLTMKKKIASITEFWYIQFHFCFAFSLESILRTIVFLNSSSYYIFIFIVARDFCYISSTCYAKKNEKCRNVDFHIYSIFRYL